MEMTAKVNGGTKIKSVLAAWVSWVRDTNDEAVAEWQMRKILTGNRELDLSGHVGKRQPAVHRRGSRMTSWIPLEPATCTPLKLIESLHGAWAPKIH